MEVEGLVEGAYGRKTNRALSRRQIRPRDEIMSYQLSLVKPGLVQATSVLALWASNSSQSFQERDSSAAGMP